MAPLRREAMVLMVKEVLTFVTLSFAGADCRLLIHCIASKFVVSAESVIDV